MCRVSNKRANCSVLGVLPARYSLKLLGDTATSNRRIDDRIRELSNRAVTASRDEAEPILQELLAVVHVKLNRIRKMAADHYLKSKPRKDRRSKPDSSDK